jgi:hypothetical protein
MDYRDDDERGWRYRGESDFRVADRRGRDRRDWDRREYERRRRDEPGVVERLVDELRSWFRDEDARRRDDREAARRWGGGARGWGERSDEEVDRGGDRDYEPRWGWGDPSAWGAERGGQPWERARGGAAAGPHTGRGPRGYQRADERIREDVCDALCEHGYVDASDIEVTVLNGEVTLIGIVRERPQKRMAEDAAEQISGVREVHNQLRVTPGGAEQDREGRPGDPRFRVA